MINLAIDLQYLLSTPIADLPTTRAFAHFGRGRSIMLMLCWVFPPGEIAIGSPRSPIDPSKQSDHD